MTQNELKRQAANAAMDYLAPKLTSEMILGIGTGSTANFFIELLGHYQGRFMGAVASSEASSRLLKNQGISIIESNDVESLAFYIDGADECNPNLEMIKGGGAALTREKIVAAATNQFICIADESKLVKKLGVFPLPVEVIPMARNQVIRALKALGGRPIYRQGCVTDNHCHIIDVHDLDIDNAPKLESDINQITGVVTNGLFARRPAEMLFLGTPDGVRIMYANMAGNQF